MSSPQDPILIHQNKSKRKRDEEEIINNPNPNVDVFLAIAPRLSRIIPKGPNLAFSPLSLRTPLSLIAASASGQTLQQLLSFLKADSIDEVNARSSELVSSVLTDSGVLQISFANSLWIQEGFNLKHSFKQVVDNVYKASSYQVDFTKGDKIVSEVNRWAKKQTNGLIKEVLPRGSVDIFTRLIVASALYFKGKWMEEYFRTSDTKEDQFHLLGGGSVKVPFMTTTYRQYIGTFDGFKVLRLLYKKGKRHDRQFSMYILLPDAKDGLSKLVEKVVLEPDFLDRHLPDEKVSVNKFRLPRFKISFGFEASAPLEKLGLSLPFKPEGLTEMVDSVVQGKKLFVSKIYQKCFIEVNEAGTEAASNYAAGQKVGLITARRILPTTKVDFVADHPFMFLIREDTTGAVLFFGHVLNPSKKGS